MDDTPSDQQGARGHRLAKTALVCGVLGFPLWLLSYSWLPFALTGHEVGTLVSAIVKISEAGGLLFSLVSVVAGYIARRQAQGGSAERRWASLGLAMGTVILVLIVGLNVLGLVLHR